MTIARLLRTARTELGARRVAVELFAGPVVVLLLAVVALGAAAGAFAVYWLGELLWWAGVRV